MDPDVRFGRRPTFATVRREDVFRLPARGRLNADFVTFDLDTARMSTAEINLVRQWIRAGRNRVHLEGDAIRRHAALLAPASLQRSQHVFREELGRGLAAALLPHPVNTDCAKLRFRPTWYKRMFFSTWACPLLKDLPADAVVVARFRGGWNETIVVPKPDDGSDPKVEGDALCGMLPMGKGKVYFRSVPVPGPDARRWDLNWWHWALDLPVPGAAAATPAKSTP
jgi:hypothetical protein